MKRTAKYQINSVSPLLMHNGRLSDPLDEWAKAMRKITDKKKKTDADHEELGRLEWMGSLYLTNGAPCIPSQAVKATLLRAAMSLKKGPKVKAGVVCELHAPLLYDGPTDAKTLWMDERFRYRTTKAMRGQRIVRTRPIFHTWATEFVINFNDELVNPSEVDEFVTIAGQSVGLLEERPDFGRYTAERVA